MVILVRWVITGKITCDAQCNTFLKEKLKSWMMIDSIVFKGKAKLSGFILTWYFSGSPHSRTGNSEYSYFFLESADINSLMMWTIQFEPVRKTRQSSLRSLNVAKAYYFIVYVIKTKIHCHSLKCIAGSPAFNRTWAWKETKVCRKQYLLAFI